MDKYIKLGRLHIKYGFNVILDDFAMGPPCKFFFSIGWFPNKAFRFVLSGAGKE